MPITSDVYEKVDFTLFDTAFLSEQRRVLFVNPLGTNDYSDPAKQLKGPAETNMMLGAMLPTPEKFSISEWSCRLFRCGAPLRVFGDEFAKANNEFIYEKTRLELLINQKLYAEAAAYDIAEWRAVFANVKCEEDAIRDRLKLVPKLNQRLDPPVMVDTQQIFCVNVHTDYPDPHLSIRVNLRGTLLRPVV